MKAQQFKKRHANDITIVDFTNEHGEKYELYIPSGAVTVYFAGDESDWDVMSLFNTKFNVWSAEELLKLADAITRGVNKAKGE